MHVLYHPEVIPVTGPDSGNESYITIPKRGQTNPVFILLLFVLCTRRAAICALERQTIRKNISATHAGNIEITSKVGQISDLASVSYLLFFIQSIMVETITCKNGFTVQFLARSSISHVCQL